MANLSQTRSRRWCFTLHNYDDGDIDSIIYDLDHSYIIYGKETCPTTGTRHLQGYFEFQHQHTGSSLKKKIPKIHLIKSNGTAEQNRIYCSKEGDFYEKGTPKKQGTRGDLAALTAEVMNGTTLDEIATEQPNMYHQYARTLQRVEDIRMRQQFRTEMTIGIWYFGETGTGKSHTALKDYTPESHYIYPNDNGWWDGYKQQETVVFNEFRGQIPYSELLTLVDKWAHHVRRRGREPLPFTSKTIIITSSLSPEEVYKNLSQNDDLAQLYRRFKIINLKKKYIETPTISN